MNININGTKISVPDGLTPEQMDEVVEDYAANNNIQAEQQSPSIAAAAEWEQRPSISERLGESFLERELNIEKIDRAIDTAQSKGDISQIAADTMRVYTKLGQGAGAVSDVFGELFSELGVAAFQAIPDNYEDQIRGTAAETISSILNTDLGKSGVVAARHGIEAYSDWKEDHPLAAANLEASFNIAELFPVGKGAKLASKGGRSVGSGVKSWGEASEKKIIKKYIDKIIEPIPTKKTKLDDVGRTEIERSLGGIGPKKKVTRQSAKMAEVSDAVETVKGIKPRNLMQENYNLLDNEIINSDKNLKASLAKNDFTFPKKELKARINKTLNKAAEVGDIVGTDGKLSVQTTAVIDKAMNLINEKKAGGVNLLEIRQELDNFVKDRTRKQSGKTAFDDVKTTDYNVVLKEIRTTINEFLDEKATLAGVDKSVLGELKRSHNIYIARDNIAEKAEKEAATWLARTAQKTYEAMPFTGSKMRTLAFLGAGATGTGVYAIAPAALAVTGGGIGLALTGSLLVKGVSHPAVRKILGNLLSATDDAITETMKKEGKQAAKELKRNKKTLIRLIEASPKIKK